MKTRQLGTARESRMIYDNYAVRREVFDGCLRFAIMGARNTTLHLARWTHRSVVALMILRNQECA